MSSKVHSSRFSAGVWMGRPHDYLSRRRRFNKVANVVLVAVFSLLLAGIIVYTSNPGAFNGHR
ncbi:MAG TPA: hypothetical protein VMT51_09450 [Dongiaceae bacterium]|nr:hypothetical protein [Dongiaceae bacterium]